MKIKSVEDLVNGSVLVVKKGAKPVLLSEESTARECYFCGQNFDEFEPPKEISVVDKKKWDGAWHIKISIEGKIAMIHYMELKKRYELSDS